MKGYLKNKETAIIETKLGPFELHSVEIPEEEKAITDLNLVDNAAVFRGTVVDHLPHGYGRLVHTDGTILEGFWKEGSLHLEGRIIYSTGAVYTGEFTDGARQGKGNLSQDDYEYVGEWENDKYHGHGYENSKSIMTKYEGEFVQGLRCGTGKLSTKDYEYQGEFKNNYREGYGELHGEDGYTYKGHWKSDKYNGEGKETLKNGSTYEGEFLNGKRYGHGRLESQNILYTGGFVNNMR